MLLLFYFILFYFLCSRGKMENKKGNARGPQK
ncbi:hypothetical protein CsSME_00036105 [Camellia sinensis var. sinensis]